uniref:Light-independent protochlorophyllide reductase subunit B n=1 Tax=Selaginella lepidophylla TaxID=59777 RepID=A0A3T0IB42_SELLP|nr:protochlorophyllide reductase ChlB subunit [Selaginella lepidophylla]AZU95883.1 protochlorophyllide reductase ChlB subunit [Selaginella lepidophylla]
MKLAHRMHAGPAHIGTPRVASPFKNVHATTHAPLGDDHFNVMRPMPERDRDFTPVTASIVDRHVLARGSQDKVVENTTRKGKEERPDPIAPTPTCTPSILQEDPQNFACRASVTSDSDVTPADANHHRVDELQAADRTLEQVVRYHLNKAHGQGTLGRSLSNIPTANTIGISTLGLHNQHDCRESKRSSRDIGTGVNQIIPEGGLVGNLQNLPRAWFNPVPHREVGLLTAAYSDEEFGMPYISTTPMGILDTADCTRQMQECVGKWAPVFTNLSVDYEPYIDQQTRSVSQAAWFSRSIDCQNLTGKRAVILGDATHAAAMTKILAREMGIRVCCAGTYCKHDAGRFHERVRGFRDEILVTDDHTEVGDMIARAEPSAIFGTQTERHVGKRLDTPCGVISSPVHIQNFPLGYRPYLGYEGTNQIADLVYNSFTLGMEDHLLDLFGGHDTEAVTELSLVPMEKDLIWNPESQLELSKIPKFVRGKIKGKTEKFARQNGITNITVGVMHAARESFGA